MSGIGGERVRNVGGDSLSDRDRVSIRGFGEPKEGIADDKLFVAVGKDFKENRSNLLWALHNSRGKKIWILHVHTPAKMIPVLGGKFPVSQVGRKEVMAHHEKERKEMGKALDEYIQLCAKTGMSAEKLVFEADSIENAIVTLVSKNRIGELVMGAAADNKYKKNMTELKSKKAIYVQLQAPGYCQIWFICKGNVINKRERAKPQYPNNENEGLNSLRSRSVDALLSSKSDMETDKYKSRSTGDGGIVPDPADMPTRRTSSGTFDVCQNLSRLSMSDSAPPSTSYEPDRNSSLSCISNMHQSSNESHFRISPLEERYVGSSYLSHLLDGSMNNDLIDQLIEEANSSKQEAYLESIKRRKAEMDYIEAIRKVKDTESLYYEEQMQRKEVEEKMTKLKEILETTRTRHAKALDELQNALYWKHKLERDELKKERDNALAETECLRRQQGLPYPTVTQSSRFFTDFTLSEIAEATDNFSPSREIGEGGFGKTYRGLLRHIEVAIKVLDPKNEQGSKEFEQEVDALSKLRHPNIVTLIGVCSDASAIIYEYVPNGSLEDRLACKDNTPPLPWQTRIQIAVELCSVLMFLHSSKPETIVHGDLKPANILLDAHLSSKLSDFGICRTISISETSTRFCITSPKGTFAYMDPEFVSSGELTQQSDVYSFGVILLRLLTGKSAFGITREVQHAMDKGKVGAVVDPLAGEWPLAVANQLAMLALGCCEIQRKSRPDLATDVWRVLEPMKVWCRSS